LVCWMARPDEHLPDDKIWTAQLFWIDGSGAKNFAAWAGGERESRIGEVTIVTYTVHGTCTYIPHDA
jgi:hypothetical protein